MKSANAQGDRESGLPFASRSEVIGQNGMVATSHPLATQIGLDVLKNGGNAIDAAIAANAAMGLMEPTGNGIGGDLYALIWHAETKQVYALNASGRSPRGLRHEQVLSILEEEGRNRIHPLSLLSVSVPGAVDGWFELHERFGEASMADILAAPIHYAENGFPVTESIAMGWNRSVPRLITQPGAFRETFTIDGRAPEKGDIFANPDLGNTFRILVEQGRDGFYKGEIARNTDAFMREHGGYLTYDDFATHTSEWIDPISTNYRGYEIYQIGENNQGTAVLQMLNILEGFDLASMGFMSADMLHVMVEAKKLAFEDRAKHYADPDFYNIPMETLISKEYAAERRALIGDRAARRVTSGVEGLRDGGTIFLTTADKHGNMVSLIQSNFRGMGTGFVVPGTGFSLQNRGELFSMDPNHPNVYAPGKRPFHTIIPGLATKDGEGWFTFGVMGGEYQPMGHVSVLTNVIDFGMNIQEAGDALRWLHTGSTEPTDGAEDFLTDGGRVQIESNIDYQVVRALRQRGHTVQIGGGFYGRYQGILFDREKGVYFGASESRVDGQAAGY
ncbi:MAG: gamma-glutamyltransferase [Balneolales bacterium]|nr:gamma-glutamyltransferase [Balneolales bacterium]